MYRGEGGYCSDAARDFSRDYKKVVPTPRRNARRHGRERRTCAKQVCASPQEIIVKARLHRMHAAGCPGIEQATK
jgi:hypothetical protein